MIQDTTVTKPENSDGLSHMQSQFCWCEPVVALDEDGQQILVHREVTWN